MGLDAMILVSWMLSFKPTFSLSSFTFIKRLLVPLHFLPWGWCHLYVWSYWYFSQKSWFQLVLHPAQNFSWCTLHISWISKVTIYSLDVLLFLFGTSLKSSQVIIINNLLLFRHLVMSDSLWSHGHMPWKHAPWKHARFPCPSPCPRVCQSSCPKFMFNRWLNT